jgi:glycosyltransferase involved in cell wall biosynthesis
MKINFLIPTTGLTGGIKIIFQHANNLSQRGHQVAIIYPYVLNKDAVFFEKLIGKLKQARRLILKIVGQDKIAWFKLDPAVKLIRVFDLAEDNIPSADATIATANETADWLVGYSELKGEKYYFIQDYENWTRDAARVDSTWKMPLKKIVVSQRLKALAEEKFQEKVFGVVPDGVDPAVFYPEERIKERDKKVLIMYHVLEKKGFKDGLEAFLLARRKYPELKLFLYGAYQPGSEIRQIASFDLQPTEDRLRELFSSCDIFLWPSRQEGFGLPPLEAMACRCAVISTDTGAIRDYSIPGRTVLLVPPEQPELMADELLKLLADDNLLKMISSGGYEKSREFLLQKSTDILENILLNDPNLSVNK